MGIRKGQCSSLGLVTVVLWSYPCPKEWERSATRTLTERVKQREPPRENQNPSIEWHSESKSSLQTHEPEEQIFWLLCPSFWSTTGTSHWLEITKARGQKNSPRAKSWVKGRKYMRSNKWVRFNKNIINIIHTEIRKDLKITWTISVIFKGKKTMCRVVMFYQNLRSLEVRYISFISYP